MEKTGRQKKELNKVYPQSEARKDVLAILAAICWTECRGRIDDDLEDIRLALRTAQKILSEVEKGA